MNRCIYCLKNSSSSTSRAHIIPESFLKNDITLPVGVECDSCNRYAGKLEQAFIHHNRIWVPIILLQAPGKRGKVRKKLGHYSIGDRKGWVNASIPKSWIKSARGQTTIQVPDPAEYDNHKFQRALCHIALNYVAWKFGWNVALENKFDPIRTFSRYGNRCMTWPYGQVQYEDSEPRKKLSIGLVSGADGLYIRLESYIDDFYIDPLNHGGLRDWVMRQSGKEVHYFE